MMDFLPLKKILQVFTLGLCLSTLAACTNTGAGANSANGAESENAAAENGVETGSIENNGQVDSISDSSGLSNPNAMVPGANQRYFFDYDKNDVHSSDLDSIKVQAQYLTSHPSAHAVLKGNTDMRGSREYNIALGERRAAAVKHILLLDGASAGQLSTISYGAEKPAASGNTEADYAQNRRVDMVYEGH